MKTLRFFLLHGAFALLCFTSSFSLPHAGFRLPDSVSELTMRFQSINNLIILPVIINDTIHVNLLLDTGCRNLVLFGKKFQHLFITDPNRKVQFAGLGEGEPVYGKLSLTNKVSIGAVLGENIPVVIVPEKNLFRHYRQIHGVIGYDIFTKFEIELNPRTQEITFRPAFSAHLSPDFILVPIRIEDSRPILNSTLMLGKQLHQCELMIDTGSSLGLLLKTTNISQYASSETRDLGKGLNGIIRGFDAVAEHLQLDGYAMSLLPAGIIASPWHNYASIGMEVLKDYSIILNYCKTYIGFRKV